jgi:glycosyltransferase involved in cell wall biosynthesis
MQQHFLKLKSAVIYQGVFPPVKGANGGDRRVRDFCIGLSHVSEKTTMLVPIWQNKGIQNKDFRYFEIHYVESLFTSIPIVRNIFFWLALCKYIISNGVNLVLCYSTTFDCIPFISYLRSKKIIVGNELCDLASHSTKGITRLKYQLNENCIPKFVDFSVGISDFICSHLHNINSKSATIKVPILVDREIFKYSENRRKSYRVKHNVLDTEILIAYVGSMYKTEGVKDLMLVGKELQVSFKNLKILVASNYVKNDPFSDDIEILSEGMDMNRVILPGWVSTEEVLDIYSAADILIVPQIKNVFNKAALPTKLAEYSSVGRAAVIASVGDINQYFLNEKHAMVYEASDINGLKESIRRLIDNESLRNDLSINIQELADKVFDNKNAGRLIIQALQKNGILKSEITPNQ